MQENFLKSFLNYPHDQCENQGKKFLTQMREIFLVDKANQTKFERKTNVPLILHLR